MSHGTCFKVATAALTVVFLPNPAELWPHLPEACEQVTTDQSAATSEIRPTEEETHVVYDKAPDVLKSNLDDIMAFYRAQRDRPIMGMGPNPYQTPIPALNRPGTEHEFYSQRSTSHTGTSEEPQSLLQVGLPQTSHYPPPTSYPNNQFSAPPQRGSGTHYQPPFSSAGEEYLDASDPNEFFIPAAFDRPPTVRVDVTSNAEGACANQNPTPATTGGQPAGVDTQNQAPPGPQIDLAAGMSILGQYWEYVKSNPHDFNGWSSLLAHVETLDNLDACRGVYNAFLPLYPYCYAYWKRYCDLERRHGNNERAMCILDRGLEAIPLSIHLWIAYLTFYRDMLKDDPDSEAKIRRQCERAIATAGLDFHSDPLWEFYIQWEADNNRLRFVTSLYRRLINTPTKLYNKHWENFLQHIRDHHPRSTLFCGEYEALKKESCEELKIPYEEEPAIPDNTPAGPPFEKSTPNSQPDEKLPSVIKEKLVAGVLEAHERTSKEVAKRWKMEDKIKRPYFHVKPLDQKQLKNWRAYLEFEEGEGDHERVVILYERALIACAHYEEFWCKYARYMENYASRGAILALEAKVFSVKAESVFVAVSLPEDGAEISGRHSLFCGTDKDGEKVVEVPSDSVEVHPTDRPGIGVFGWRRAAAVHPNCSTVFWATREGDEAVNDVGERWGGVSAARSHPSPRSCGGRRGPQVPVAEVPQPPTAPVELPIPGDLTWSEVVPERSVPGLPIPKEEARRLLSKNGEKKPPVDKGAPVVVGLSGEEEDAIKAEMAAAAQRAMAKARELLGGRPMEAKTEENDDPVIHKISTFELPDAKVLHFAENDCASWLPPVPPQGATHEATASPLQPPRRRFGASLILSYTYRNVALRSFLIPDISHVPLVDGVSSGLSSMKKTPLEAIREVYRRACIVHCPSKPLSRLQWAKFEEEEGNLDQSRELIEQVEAQYPSLMLAQVQRVNLERRLGNLAKAEELFEHYKGGETSKSAASWWAIKHARFCFKILGKPDKALAIIRKAMKRDKSNPSLFHAVLDVCYQRYPVDMKGFCAASDLALRNKELAPQHKLEFARKKMMFLREFGQLKALRRATEEYLELRRQVPVDPASHRALPVTRTVEVQTDSSAEGEKEVDKKEPKDKKFNAVPAPEEDYGFVTRHYSSYEDAKQVEYKKLTDKGYKDKRDDPSDEDEDEGEVVDEAALKGRKNRKKRKAAREVEEDGKSVIRTADGQLVPKYVLPPKLPKLKKRPAESSSGSSKKKKKKKSKDVESADEGQVDEPIPPQLNPPASDQNVLNIPDWFVKDGGELLISETSNGRSILRYWPRFFNDRGNLRMLKSLRSSVKWHQKRIRIAGQYKNQPRLVSWFGPCDYSYQGIVMEMDDNWPPELLDLLHRIISFTGTEYNSCFLNLYRSGNDSIAWHSDDHPALGRNPTIATVSLGAVRSMELVKKHGVTHMLRFPLLPGSLFVMEGSTQEDWLHQVPKDMDVQGERISLVFRVMYAMDGDGGEATQGALDSASPVSSPEGDENAAMGGPRGMPGGVPRPAMHLQMPPHMLPPPVSQQGPHPQQMRPPLMGLPPLGPGGMPVNQGPAMGHTLGPPPIQGAPPQMMNNAQPGAPPFFRNPPPMGPGDQGFMNTPPPGFPPIQLPQGTGGPIVVESLGAPPSTQSTIPLGLGATPISGGFGGAPPSSLRDQPGALPRFSPNIPPPRLLTFQRGLPAPTSIRHPPVSTSGPPPFHATGPSRSETPSHPHQNRSPLIGTAPNRPLLGDSPNMPSAPPRHPGMGSSHNLGNEVFPAPTLRKSQEQALTTPAETDHPWGIQATRELRGEEAEIKNEMRSAAS
ncbi:unnamed protein product [Cyprideis torosa]|uniref:Uncharacterized protein n=1 Tax=Cyprideis torosa TaxID=163714 RepID=A0A7R8ZHU8_9CRUS|nr:unnamed protein product [Cyprideis torosa]CAG0884593.1 unnamed protein product [Cyprideis torosa]